MRLSLHPTLAIARRDLAQQLKGRRGWVLPVIAAGLLLPAASLRFDGLGGADQPVVRVGGAVLESIAALDGVEVVDKRVHTLFVDEEGTTLVKGRPPTPAMREILDADGNGLVVEDVKPSARRPGRTLLLALISASVLTGAVSESIAGERSRRTLQALLAAAVTRLEVVLGKWGAWAGFGALSALAAASVAMLAGHVEPGWWLLPMPTVPMGTVALGMYLTRRATDVVSGATVSLRVLPAVLSVLGLASWFLGTWEPLLGAAVPIGGALVATGATWPGAAAPALATLTTLGACAALLAGTSRELERDPGRSRAATRLSDAVVWLVIAAIAWWTPLLGPLLWGPAGNPHITAGLDPGAGLAAAAIATALWVGLRAARAPNPFAITATSLSAPGPTASVDLRPSGAWAAALPVAAVLLVAGATSGELAPVDTAARARLAGALLPSSSLSVAIAVIAAQELAFRGVAQRTMGPVLATVVWIAVLGPLDPVTAASIGVSLAALARLSGSIWPGLLARVGAVVLAPSLPDLPAETSAVALVLACAIAIAAARVPAPDREGATG